MESYIKSFIKRFLFGMCIGVFINQAILLLIGYSINGIKGSVPINILSQQFIIAAVGGGIISAISVIYNIEKVSLLVKSAIHSLIALICYISMAILGGWFKANSIALISNIIFFIGFYIVTWCFKYFKGKRKVDEINYLLKKNSDIEKI